MKSSYIILVLLLSNIINSTKINIKRNEILFDLPYGFSFYNNSNLTGPITVNREKDDGTKRNLYSIVKDESELFYYDNKKFDKLEKTMSENSVYFCEMSNNDRPERQKGYDISCPKHYKIVIKKAFYGRYANDTNTCKPITGFTPEKMKKIIYDCGYEPIKDIKERCEGKIYCSLKPRNSFYYDKCYGVEKYLNVKYYCKRDDILKKEKIAIVNFFNGVESNTIDENSISEFYQYAKIHGYEYKFNNINYNPERKIYFMKFYVIIEMIIKGLKKRKYDWIFWVDTDTIITNPNIKLESFLPNDEMNKVHLIIADDKTGLQAGIFFIRVHEWSLNILMRALTYNYYNNKFLKYHDQSALNNVLTELDEFEHYVIVPQTWFNNNYNTIKKGDFLLHIMGNDKNGRIGKDKIFKTFRKRIEEEEGWYNKTNKEMREEVLQYYSLPKNEQHSISIQ